MNVLVVTQPPEAAKAETAAQMMLAMAEEFTIDSPAMYQAAGGELQAVTRRMKDIEAQRVYLKEPYLEGGRRIDAFFKAPLDLLKQAESLLKSRMVTFQTAEAAKAAEIRRAAEEAARIERAEQERIRQAAEAEERRIRDEQAAADRAARAEADRLRKAGDEAAARAAEQAAAAARMIAEQEAAAAAETAAVASEAIELADVAPVALPAVAAPTATGISTRQNWQFEVTDFPALVREAARRDALGDPTLIACLMPDKATLGKVAKALKAQARIPGVRIYNDPTLAVRAA